MNNAMNDFNKIGKKLKQIRKSKKITQTELGNLLGKSLRTIQKYEYGEIEIPLNIIFKICNLFDVSIDEIIENTAEFNLSDDEINNLSILNKNMQSIRTNKKISVKELALRANMSETAIYQYQSGLRCPSINALYKIANALGVTQAELLGEPKKEIEIQKLSDEDLIGELKIRGYTISKIF